MDEYEVVVSKNGKEEVQIFCADFIHIKEGTVCLYERGTRGEQPTIIAAFSNPVSVQRL